MEPGVAVGWIVVVGFAATLVITLLGLVKRLPIEDRYLKMLFSLLIVEMIAAGFTLFRQEYQAPETLFTPALPEAYLFDKHGTPIGGYQLFVGDQSTHSFDLLESELFKEVQRSMKIEKDHIYVIAEKGTDTYHLGWVDLTKVKEEIPEKPLTSDLRFHLGMRFADCVPPNTVSCENRRNARRAVEELFQALELTEKGTDENEEAVMKLFHLAKYFKSCEDFEKVSRWIEKYRSLPHRYHELADIQLKFVSKLDPPRAQRLQARKMALKNYLAFLRVTAERAPDQLIAASKKGAVELVGGYLAEDSAIGDRREAFLTAIESRDGVKLESLGDHIESAFSCQL